MKRKKLLTLIGTLCLILTLVAIPFTACTPETPTPAALSFEGETIVLVVPYSCGGGTDIIARIYAE